MDIFPSNNDWQIGQHAKLKGTQEPIYDVIKVDGNDIHCRYHNDSFVYPAEQLDWVILDARRNDPPPAGVLDKPETSPDVPPAPGEYPKT